MTTPKVEYRYTYQSSSGIIMATSTKAAQENAGKRLGIERDKWYLITVRRMK